MRTVNRTSHHKNSKNQANVFINIGQHTISEVQSVHWKSSCNVIRNPLANIEKLMQLKKGRKYCVSVKAHVLLERLTSLFNTDRSKTSHFE